MRSLFLCLLIACPSADKGSNPGEGEGEGEHSGEGEGEGEPLPTVGSGVLLYNGSGGGAYDIYEEDLVALYESADIPVTLTDTIPADFEADHGVLILLSPSGFDDTLVSAGQTLLAGGGRLVVVTEHGGFGDHEGAAEYLARLGSTLVPVERSITGELDLELSSLAPLTDGVSAMTLFYAAEVEPGEGAAVGVYEDATVIAAEEVDQGQVVVVCDGSVFGYVLEEADNTSFVLNLASL